MPFIQNIPGLPGITIDEDPNNLYAGQTIHVSSSFSKPKTGFFALVQGPRSDGFYMVDPTLLEQTVDGQAYTKSAGFVDQESPSATLTLTGVVGNATLTDIIPADGGSVHGANVVIHAAPVTTPTTPTNPTPPGGPTPAHPGGSIIPGVSNSTLAIGAGIAALAVIALR